MILSLKDVFIRNAVATSLLVLILFSSCNNEKSINGKKNLVTSTASAKERLHKQIESDINFYIETLNDKRFDELVEVTSTKQFVTKSLKDYKLDLIKQNIAGVYKQVNLKKIEKISEILEHKNEYYVKIYCTGDVILNVNGDSANMIDKLKMEFELSYDTPDAVISNNQIIIKDAYFSFIAISKKGSNYLWKYIEVDKQKEPFYDKIIPAEILDKF